jgi:uncharacterized tellurite resistance protein B-like protein
MTIERTDFQKFLFRTAFCIMSCDGDIDDREVAEIKKMNQSSVYFQGIDLSGELEILLSDLKTKGKDIVDELFDTLSKYNISTVQELLILEVALRMIYADEKVDENEIKFLRFLRSKLKIHDETIRDRFGVIEFLFDKDYSQDIIKKEVKNDLFSSISIPEVADLIIIDFSEI